MMNKWMIRFLIVGMLFSISFVTGCARNNDIPPQVPDSPLFKLGEAQNYLRKGQCDKAVGLLTEVIPDIQKRKGIPPSQIAELYYYRGLAYLCQKRYDLALTDMQQALVIEPLYYPAKNGLGIVYTETGEFQKAEKAFMELLNVQDFPRSATYFNLAKLYVQEEQWTKALFVARKAVELAPDELGPRLLFAQILEHHKLYQDARIQYEEILKKWPKNLVAMSRLARTYEKLQMTCKAKYMYYRILETDPVGDLADQATRKLQVLPCSEPLFLVPPPGVKEERKTEKPQNAPSQSSEKNAP